MVSYRSVTSFPRSFWCDSLRLRKTNPVRSPDLSGINFQSVSPIFVPENWSPRNTPSFSEVTFPTIGCMISLDTNCPHKKNVVWRTIDKVLVSYIRLWKTEIRGVFLRSCFFQPFVLNLHSISPHLPTTILHTPPDLPRSNLFWTAPADLKQ
jgi:hypothetical protein